MAKIKSVFKAIDVAFSIYSKIPMPRFEWASEDMKYHLCFFPWVGAVIGVLEWGWYLLSDYMELGQIIVVFVSVVIPLLVTGGFHVDGFMDTMDALHSYQSRERKLEILKDPHIGAFSVICLVTYMLLALGFVSEVSDKKAVEVLCIMFFIARAVSGLSVVCMKSAKEKGMLTTFSNTAEKNTVIVALVIQLIIGAALMLYISLAYGLAAIGCFAISFGYYKYKSYKEFGGITGDLAGWFVTVAELVAAVGVSIVSKLC